MGKPTRPREKRPDAPSASLRTGIIAFVFLIIGYQAALMIARVGSLHRDSQPTRPDTVYLLAREEVEAFLSRFSEAEICAAEIASISESSPDSRSAFVPIHREAPKPGHRSVESFRFDPNTVSIADLVRLGFSQKQAEAIDHYRQKGGRFRRKEDFARSYVVDDSVYRRLEPWIDIPRLDLNSADSAALTTLPGIGPYFAARIVELRTSLGGFSYQEQLLDIPRFDREKYEGLKALISLSPPEPYPLWILPEEELKKHPYIRAYAARGIVFYREHQPPEEWSIEGLEAAGILDAADGEKLSRCRIAPP